MTTNQERAEELMANARNVVSFKQLAQALADAGLIAPDLLTLAELIEQGNDPAQYQWVQAKIFEHASTIGIITCIDRYQNHSTVLFSDGVARLVDNYQITPLPDEPKLEWPSLSVSGESEPLSVETEESEGCSDASAPALMDALIAEERAHQRLRAEIEGFLRSCIESAETLELNAMTAYSPEACESASNVERDTAAALTRILGADDE